MVFIHILFFIHSVCAIDYCKMCENRTHTLCQYEKGPGTSCFDYHKIDLTDQLKNYIVDIHNDIRNHVASGHELKGRLGSQPPASNMNQLEWDDELASMAQRWADQCISINSTVQHDTCKSSERFDVGQNILTAITMDKELPELAILILNWYKQVSDVIPSDVNYFSGIRRGQFLIGQYTQLVWAETKYIGCGISIFRDPGNLYYNQRLVCNYGPGGNVIGDSVYVRGRPCTKCPNKRCDSYRNNLCQNSSPNHTKMVPSIILSDESFELYQPSDQSPCFITSEGFIQSDLNSCIESLGDLVTLAQKSMDEIYFSTVIPTTTLSHFLRNITVHIPHQKTEKPSTNSKIIDNNAKVINMRNNIKNIGHDAEVSKKKMSYHESELYRLENLNEGMESYHHQKQHKYEDFNTRHKVNDEEVVFPNNVRFKRAMGKWHDGHCRCNRIYRSSFAVHRFQQTLLIFTCFLNMV